MGIYREVADDRPIKAYINVSGGMASVGRTIGKEAFRSGLNTELPTDAKGQDGVMHRFVRDGVTATDAIHAFTPPRLAQHLSGFLYLT